MAQTLLDASEIILYSPTAAKYDPRKLEPWILPAEQDELYGWLGREFYSELVFQKRGGTLTPANTTFWEDYLRHAGALMIFAYAYPHLGVDVSSQGIQVNSTLHSEPAGQRLVSYLAQDMKEKSNRAKHRSHDFLTLVDADAVPPIDNPALYPLYPDNSISCDAKAAGVSEQGGIILRNTDPRYDQRRRPGGGNRDFWD